ALSGASGAVGRALVAALAPGADLGATSAAWPSVAQRVRRGTLTLLAHFTTALNSSPELLHDPTTTLLSRAVLDLALTQEIAVAERHGRPLALLLMAIDRLDTLEQRLGPGAGERVLERVGILTRRYFRTHDWLARFDASTVCAVLPETDPGAVATLAERFRVRVRDRLVLEDHRHDTPVPATPAVAAAAADVIPAAVAARALTRRAT